MDKRHSENHNEDDVAFEVDPDMESSGGQIKKMREKLKACNEERQEYLEGWQRAKADFINFKNESTKREKDIRSRAQEELIFEVLSVLDSFETAIGNTNAWESVDEGWRKGVEHIYTQLLHILSDYGITEIAPQKGDAFDPQIHDAAEKEEVEKGSDNTIVAVLQKGYCSDKRVLRPARVRVGVAHK